MSQNQEVQEETVNINIDRKSSKRKTVQINDVKVDYDHHDDVDQEADPIAKFHSKQMTDLHKSLESKDLKQVKLSVDQFYPQLKAAKLQQTEFLQGIPSGQEQRVEEIQKRQLEQIMQMQQLHGEAHREMHGKNDGMVFIITLILIIIYAVWCKYSFDALGDELDGQYADEDTCESMYKWQKNLAISLALTCPFGFLNSVIRLIASKQHGSESTATWLQISGCFQCLVMPFGLFQFISLCGLTNELDQDMCGEFGDFCRFSVVFGWCIITLFPIAMCLLVCIFAMMFPKAFIQQ